MDPCPALTLQLLRQSQEALHPSSSATGWFFVPEGRLLTWDEARAALATAPKPVFVAPLVEPGHVATWPLDRLPAADGVRWARELANQQAFYGERLQGFGLADADAITLELPFGEFRLSVADFRRWATEYAVAAVGVGLIRGPEPRTGRLTIHIPGGGRQPLGWVDTGGCC
jgi:hypothetical protein